MQRRDGGSPLEEARPPPPHVSCFQVKYGFPRDGGLFITPWRVQRWADKTGQASFSRTENYNHHRSLARWPAPCLVSLVPPCLLSPVPVWCHRSVPPPVLCLRSPPCLVSPVPPVLCRRPAPGTHYIGPRDLNYILAPPSRKGRDARTTPTVLRHRSAPPGREPGRSGGPEPRAGVRDAGQLRVRCVGPLAAARPPVEEPYDLAINVTISPLTYIIIERERRWRREDGWSEGEWRGGKEARVEHRHARAPSCTLRHRL